MLVKFWGVRGSTPTPQSENLRYGGNTSCVEVRVNGHIYVFDCGTGFRNLGKQLCLEQEVNGKNGHPIKAHIFLSHSPWAPSQGSHSSPRSTTTAITLLFSTLPAAL